MSVVRNLVPVPSEEEELDEDCVIENGAVQHERNRCSKYLEKVAVFEGVPLMCFLDSGAND